MTEAAGSDGLVPPAAVFGQNRNRAAALMSLLQVHWFIRLRWAFVAAALAVLALERFVTPAAVRPGALVVPILLLAIVNLVWMGLEDFLLRQFRSPAEEGDKPIRRAMLFANAQVAVDLFILTLILRYTGGVENPMAVFYLFHMGIGAQLLRPWHAIAQGVWAILLYSVLAIGECARWITPHWDFLPQFASPGLYARPEFVVAMLTVMACGVFATLYFTLHITGRLDEREQQLREAYDALKRSEAAIFDLQQRRSRFLQTAAHQLKGPLAAIETMVGLLRDRIVPETGIESTYSKIAERCREGTQQVTELLTLARVQRADPRRHRRSLANVGRVASEVCARYMAQAERKGVALRCRVPENEGFFAQVDPADLTDCISNLVDNAIKFTNGPGEVSVSVCSARECASLLPPTDAVRSATDATAPRRVPAELTEDGVCVIVRDTGIGIESEALAGAEGPAGKGSVFDAFRRGNNALAAGIPGTGLGLAIVREVVEQAEGWIFVRSIPGEGSTFAIVIPSRTAPTDEPTIRDTRSSVVVLPGNPPAGETLPAPPAEAGPQSPARTGGS